MATKADTKTIVIEAISEPTQTLEGMRINSKLYFPNRQRVSVQSTITRLKDRSEKRFSLKRINDEYTMLKRIK